MPSSMAVNSTSATCRAKHHSSVVKKRLASRPAGGGRSGGSETESTMTFCTRNTVNAAAARPGIACDPAAPSPPSAQYCANSITSARKRTASPTVRSSCPASCWASARRPGCRSLPPYSARHTGQRGGSWRASCRWQRTHASTHEACTPAMEPRHRQGATRGPSSSGPQCRQMRQGRLSREVLQAVPAPAKAKSGNASDDAGTSWRMRKLKRPTRRTSPSASKYFASRTTSQGHRQLGLGSSQKRPSSPRTCSRARPLCRAPLWAILTRESLQMHCMEKGTEKRLFLISCLSLLKSNSSRSSMKSPTEALLDWTSTLQPAANLQGASRQTRLSPAVPPCWSTGASLLGSGQAWDARVSAGIACGSSTMSWSM
mmetsp:Transcript_37024/g.114074  ORF Transcript_37024/g.114074 Transcript_37024/m.114074 type:complete len:372 (+) Transcript_37024:350-1465(+)